MIELLGVLAAIFELLAIFLLGKKLWYGFVSNIIGNSLWVTYVVLSKSAY